MAHLSKNKPTDEKLREICKANGLKATSQRIEILKIVSAAKDHPSVDLIHKQVKSRIPGISFDTVYRTLSSLEEHKLISRVHHLDDKTRYDPNTSEHHHFVCTSCKAIVDFEWSDFASLELPKAVLQLGRIEQKYVEIRGLCPKCSKHG
jgi:Fur family transcriptional regulator, peroxide stress response regulator